MGKQIDLDINIDGLAEIKLLLDEHQKIVENLHRNTERIENQILKVRAVIKQLPDKSDS